VIDVREIGDLATMPGKEELFSKLLFLIQSPAQRLATVINATGRDLAVVINQGVEKGKFAGAAAPAAVVEAPKAEAKVEETPVAEAKVEETPVAVVEAPVAEAPAAEGQLVAEAHAVEAPGADATAEQPENSTASQGGEAATTDPVEG
jgi:large subunit ribosomal protein L10